MSTPSTRVGAGGVALYGVATRDQSFDELNPMASQQESGASHRLLGVLL
ncbi:hypothetical protein ACIQYF_15020 [Pseudomonas sp. NPDC096917]